MLQTANRSSLDIGENIHQQVKYFDLSYTLSPLVQSSCASKLCTGCLIRQVTLSQLNFSGIQTETEISMQGIY